MTEAEWQACGDPRQMIGSLTPTVWIDRRRRLFAVACCRNLDVLFDESSTDLIEIAERLGDERAEDAELDLARRFAYNIFERGTRHDVVSWRDQVTEVLAAAVAFPVREYVAIEAFVGFMSAEHVTQREISTLRIEARATLANLVRELVGNPFQPVVFSPEWRTDTALLLAQQMYESRDFSGLPILADALQDAGCDNESILRHCRGGGVHIRGCWVVDLVLNRS